MGCFSGRLMSAASDQKLFCKLCSPFCCFFNEFVEEKGITPSYSSAILRLIFLSEKNISWGFPGGASGKEPVCKCRRRKRCKFDPWVRKEPLEEGMQPTPVFLPGKSHVQRSTVHGVTKSRTSLK